MYVIKNDLLGAQDNVNQHNSNILGGLIDIMNQARSGFADRHVRKGDMSIDYNKDAGQFPPGEDILPICILNKDIKAHVYFNEYSLRLLCKMMGVPVALMEKLIEDDNLCLLAKNIQHYYNHYNSDELLIRLKEVDSNKNGKSYVVRAILPGNYNRLDSIYLVSSIDKICNNRQLQIKNIYFDGDNFGADLILPDKRELLSKVGDEVVAGICMHNSEIGENGYTHGLVASVYFERLICTNGMTTNSKKRIVIKGVEDILATQYYNVLPPYPLHENLQNEIDSFVENEILNQLLDTIDGEFSVLQNNLQKLLDVKISEEDINNRLHSIVRILMRTVGLPALGRDAMNGIDEAFIIEQAETGGNALTLFHAITRYASQVRLDKNSKDQRRAQFGRKITYNTYKLSEPTVNWGRILKKAEKDDSTYVIAPTV